MLSDLTARQAKVTGKAYTLADFDGLYWRASTLLRTKLRMSRESTRRQVNVSA